MSYTIGTAPMMQFTMGQNAPMQQPGAWPRVAIGAGAPTDIPAPQHAQAAAQIPRQAPRVSFAAPMLSVEQLEFCRTTINAMLASRPEEDADIDEDTQARDTVMLALAKSTLEGLNAWIETANIVVPEPEQAPRPVAPSFGRQGIGMPMTASRAPVQRNPHLASVQTPGQLAPGQTPAMQMIPNGPNAGSRVVIGNAAPLKFTMEGSGQFARSIPDPSNAVR